MGNFNKSVKNDRRFYYILVLLAVVAAGLWYSGKRKDDALELQKAELVSSAEMMEEIPVEVYIYGGVQKEGLYQLTAADTIGDVIAMAGGYTQDGNPEQIREEDAIFDGEKIFIPSKSKDDKGKISYYNEIEDDEVSSTAVEEESDLPQVNNEQSESLPVISEEPAATVETVPQEETPALAEGSLININTANEEQLNVLPGIGEKLAANIIAYRTEYGDFQSIEEIKNVNGIGEKRFEAIKDMITI